MSKMHIERSIHIKAPAHNIYKVISDFNDWRPWSPWLLMEPEARVKVAPDSKSYEWEGDRTGSGKMEILEEKENEFIDYDLNFLKPWKSHANTNFTLSREREGTKVTWRMDSSLPFFLFFMKKRMEAYVGADYERGLDMLKVYVESGEVPSKLDFVGNNVFEGTRFIGIKTACSIDTIDEQMESDFEKVRKYAAEENIQMKEMMTIYHKWDIPKNKATYTAALGLEKIPDNLPTEFISGTIPNAECYVLKHTGRYQYLGNAWSTLYTMMRNKEIKHNKKIDPFEVYLNYPQSTEKKDPETEIYLPVR
ncbi:MAG: SRPBCC family protein [Ekhidna sp.]|nr:SRPBCC family protein [Ekhidna sp.]